VRDCWSEDLAYNLEWSNNNWNVLVEVSWVNSSQQSIVWHDTHSSMCHTGQLSLVQWRKWKLLFGNKSTNKTSIYAYKRYIYIYICTYTHHTYTASSWQYSPTVSLSVRTQQYSLSSTVIKHRTRFTVGLRPIAVDFNNVARHLCKLIYKSLTVDFIENASRVVVPTSTNPDRQTSACHLLINASSLHRVLILSFLYP